MANESRSTQERRRRRAVLASPRPVQVAACVWLWNGALAAHKPLCDLCRDDSERGDSDEHRDAPDNPSGNRHREHIAVADRSDRCCRPPQRVIERPDATSLADVLSRHERGCGGKPRGPAAPSAMRPALRRRYARLSDAAAPPMAANRARAAAARSPRTPRSARSRPNGPRYGRIASPWVTTISREVHS